MDLFGFHVVQYVDDTVEYPRKDKKIEDMSLDKDCVLIP